LVDWYFFCSSFLERRSGIRELLQERRLGIRGLLLKRGLRGRGLFFFFFNRFLSHWFGLCEDRL